MRKLSYIFMIIAILLSNIMCAVVAYNYRSAICAIQHNGFSAPANIAFFYAIPFVFLIVICLVFAYVFYKKTK